MSRSLLAWTKSCALGAARRSVAPSQVQGNLGCERPVLTVSSLTALISMVAASMVTLTFTPVALGQVGTSHARPTSGQGQGGAPTMYVALSHNSRNTNASSRAGGSTQGHNSNPSSRAGGSTHGQNANADALVYGAGYTTTYGSQAVIALQRRLADLGYQPGPIDGRYGPLTAAAVRRFQVSHGLAADGIAGVRTLAAVAAAKPVLYPGLGYGSTGSAEVRSLQRYLAAAGFSPGPVDGRYGPLTERAVTRFQAARHLRVDGVAGPQTLSHLQALRSTQAVHPPRNHHPQHQTPSHRSTGRPQPRPTPAPRAAGPHGNTAPPTPRQPRRHSAGFPLVWIIVLAGLVLAVLASRLWHRGRRDDDDSRDRPVEPRGRPVEPGRQPVEPGARAAVPPAPARADACEDSPASVGLADRRGGSPHETKSQYTRQQDGEAALRLGFLLAQKGDSVAAKEAFRQAEKRGHPDAAFELCALSLQEGDHDGAEDAFRRADRRGDGGAACNLGVLLEQRGDLVGAKEAYERADMRGHRVGACNLGALLEQQGDRVAAMDAYARADQRGDATGAYHLGLMLKAQGELNGARDAFERADRRGHPDAAFDLGTLLVQEGDHAGAEDAFRRADHHGDGGAACNLGVLLEQRGDLLGAMEAYQRADMRGHDVGACNLGALLEQQGDLVAARDAYERADQRGDSAGAYHLGVLLEREGEREAAKEAYLRADERGHPEAACSLGQLLKDEGDRTGAVRAFQRAGERGSPELVNVARAALLELDPDEEDGR